MPFPPTHDERLTTGRRHIRAGSVRVSELIRKQPPPFEVPSLEPLGESPTTAGLDPDQQAPGAHRRPVSKAARLAKTAGLGVATLVLCVSVAYGSMITHQRREQASPDAAVPRPAVDIRGEQALLPDLLNRAVPTSGSTGLPELPGPTTSASQAIENPGRDVPPPGRRSTSPAEPPVAAEPVSKTELVQRFYQLVSTMPAKAFALLDPNLLHTDVTTFVRSWSTVSNLELLDVREQGDEVLAVVRLRLPDGGHLRVQQLLHVASTAPQRIVGAEILSAQRN